MLGRKSSAYVHRACSRQNSFSASLPVTGTLVEIREQGSHHPPLYKIRIHNPSELAGFVGLDLSGHSFLLGLITRKKFEPLIMLTGIPKRPSIRVLPASKHQPLMLISG